MSRRERIATVWPLVAVQVVALVVIWTQGNFAAAAVVAIAWIATDVVIWVRS